MKRYSSLVVAIIFLFLGCSGTKSMKVTETNQDEVLEAVRKSGSLNQEEKELILAYLMRSQMSGLFGTEKSNPAGKTVGEIIQEQKTYIAKEKEREEKEKQLALQEKAKEEARISQLKKSISVLAFDLKPRGGLFDGMEVKYVVSNADSRDVRAFQGRLVIMDILGAEVADTEVKSLTPLHSGEKRNESEFMPFMLYGSLRGKKFEDLKFQWKPTTVLLTDGTVLGEQPKSRNE